MKPTSHLHTTISPLRSHVFSCDDRIVCATSIRRSSSPWTDQLHIHGLHTTLAAFCWRKLKLEDEIAARQLGGIDRGGHVRVVKEDTLVGRVGLPRVNVPQIGTDGLHKSQEAESTIGMAVTDATDPRAKFTPRRTIPRRRRRQQIRDEIARQKQIGFGAQISG